MMGLMGVSETVRRWWTCRLGVGVSSCERLDARAAWLPGAGVVGPRRLASAG